MIRSLLLLVFVCVAAGSYYAYSDYQSYLQSPVNVETQGTSFIIERGWSAKRVSAELEKQGIIEKRYWFDAYARLSEKANRIKSGEFVLTGDITVPELFDVFLDGQTRQYTHTIIEGSNWKQVLESISDSDNLTLTLPGDLSSFSASELMQQLGFAELHPEGQFFSDTYAYPKNTSDIEYLKRAKRTMDTVLQEEWENRADGLPLKSPYEALILASIVEKETAVAAERPLIAGVFLSRLNKKMRLQTDPTVIYGMGDAFDGNIRRKDLTTDTPYNTYTRAGLPPTPIAMVGREAIHAVLNPESTTALYFVSRGDGTHQFSETLEQHNAAVRKYQLKR